MNGKKTRVIRVIPDFAGFFLALGNNPRHIRISRGGNF